MNHLTTVEYKGHSLSLIHHAENVWMTSEAIGQALEYDNPRVAINNLFNRNCDELEEYSSVIKLMTHDHDDRKVLRDTRIFNEEGVMLLCMFSNQLKAKEFRKWAVTILKAHRHGQYGLKKIFSRSLERVLHMEGTY